MNIDVQTSPDQVSLLRTDLGQSLNIGLKHFDIEYLEGKECITRTATGRSTVYFFKQGTSEIALRHYYRGGLPAKLNKDWFVYTGIENTRCFQELSILELLSKKGLNVAQAVAAKVTRTGLFYRSDIMTLAVQNARELHEMLQHQPVDDEIWHNIGVCLAKLHNEDVRHDDINVKNILINQKREPVLIDFDKCQQQSYGNWKSANIARFYRSLIKQAKACSEYHFAQSNWETLQTGYTQTAKPQP